MEKFNKNNNHKKPIGENQKKSRLLDGSIKKVFHHDHNLNKGPIKTYEDKDKIEKKKIHLFEKHLKPNIDHYPKDDLFIDKNNLSEELDDSKNPDSVQKNAINVDINKKKEKKAKPLPPPTYVVTHYKSTIGFFSKVYRRNDMTWRVFIMCIVGVLMSFTSLLFIQNTGVYISGTSGVFQGIARVLKVVMIKNNVDQNIVNLSYQLLFYGLYLINNIPLIIFSWFKMGKRFTILSSIPVLISNILPLIMNQIPGINNFFIFGNTTNPDEILKHYEVQLLNFHDTAESGQKAVYMFLYSIFAGLINGLAYSMALAVGGSTGGLDFITFFLAYKKKKTIGTVMLIFNSSSVLISSFIGSFLAAGIADPKFFTFYNFISQNLMSGIIYVLTINIVIAALFPKDKIVKIQVYCDDVIAIRNHLYSINFNHSLTINTTTGGYSLQEKKNIEIICLFIEVPKILSQIKKIDRYMLITITPIKGIDGRLSVEDALN